MYMYVIRHGETEWNRLLKLQGRTDIPLNDNGINMAHKASEGLKNVNFTRIITSPLSRAVETANIIKRDRDIPVIIDDRIIEIGFGANEGCEYDKNKPDQYPELARFFREPDVYVPARGGETIEQLKNRTAEFLKDIMKRYGSTDEVILLSVHGAVIRGIMSYIKGTALKDFWRGGVQSNCGVTLLEVSSNSINILSENVTYN